MLFTEQKGIEMSRNLLNANDRSTLLDQLRKRNLNETERFLKLIKSRKPHNTWFSDWFNLLLAFLF